MYDIAYSQLYNFPTDCPWDIADLDNPCRYVSGSGIVTYDFADAAYQFVIQAETVAQHYK